MPLLENAYRMETAEVLKELNTNKNGLTHDELSKRLRLYGHNELRAEDEERALKIFLRQFKNVMVLILLIATFLSLLIGNMIDAVVIVAFMILNVILGFVQEYKAERAMEELKKMSALSTTVLRAGVEKIIPTTLLVPGDIILLKTGDKVPADARVLEIFNLRVDESAITGESVPDGKGSKKLLGVLPLGDRTNMLFSGTIVVSGKCKAIVVNTGMDTELGKITELVQSAGDIKTPLQKRLANLGKWLGVIASVACAMVFVIGVMKNLETTEMLMTALALAVSSIPEALPAIVTIALAMGVQRMLRKKALIRELQAVETLGCTTVICSDKTGTLTRNEMTVSEIFVNNQKLKITGDGYKTQGGFYSNGKKISPEKLELLLKIGASCNDSTLPNIGDPTEIALLVVAAKAGLTKERNRVNEIPFSSEKKYMATMHEINNELLTYVKGAPEKILEMCSHININGRVRKLTKKDKDEVLRQNMEMANNALRVLGMAYKNGKDVKNLVFTGLVGMMDLPREEVKDAINLCKCAGIRVAMLTGDHKLTAMAIARQVGIEGDVLEGADLDKIDDKKLRELVKSAGVYARLSPEHKVRVLDALQKNGEVVAMTGDGVNDAPSLKKANVGIAMSLRGTDVAREASDMVLLDDDFSSIVSAVKEGRVIYDNIKKSTKFLLSVNFSELGVILFSLLLGFPLPFLPLHILWVNLVTDSLPAIALSMEKSDKNIMKRKPRDQNEGILKNLLPFLLTVGLIACLSALAIFALEYLGTGNLVKARTLALTTTIFFELLFISSCRSDRSVFEIGFFSNKYLIWAILISVVLQLSIIYTPLNAVFGMMPLSLMDWAKVLFFSSTGFLFFEGRKLLKR